MFIFGGSSGTSIKNTLGKSNTHQPSLCFCTKAGPSAHKMMRLTFGADLGLSQGCFSPSLSISPFLTGRAGRTGCMPASVASSPESMAHLLIFNLPQAKLHGFQCCQCKPATNTGVVMLALLVLAVFLNSRYVASSSSQGVTMSSHGHP